MQDESQTQINQRKTIPDQFTFSQQDDQKKNNRCSLVGTLTEICGSDKIVAIYSNELSISSKFFACLVLAMSSENVLLALIDPYGYYDGFVVLQISTISRIEIATKYCNLLQKLWDETDIKHDLIEQKYEDQYLNLLAYSYEKKKVISADIYDNGKYDIVGYITCMDGHEIRIDKVDEYGDFDGFSVIFLSDISFLACDSQDEQKLDRICKINAKSTSKI